MYWKELSGVCLFDTNRRQDPETLSAAPQKWLFDDAKCRKGSFRVSDSAIKTRRRVGQVSLPAALEGIGVCGQKRAIM